MPGWLRHRSAHEAHQIGCEFLGLTDGLGGTIIGAFQLVTLYHFVPIWERGETPSIGKSIQLNVIFLAHELHVIPPLGLVCAGND